MSQKQLRIDYALCMAEGVGEGNGLSAEVLESEKKAFAQGLERVLGRV